jgi:lipoyl(octanoyl) transferase
MRTFQTLQAGRLPYRSALGLQERLLQERRTAAGDILLLLEHPPVITLGRSAHAQHLLLSETELARRGIELSTVSRGGDVTWHGPGQLVGYPICDLQPLGRDLHRYLRLLEELLIDTLAAFGVVGERRAGKTGVWVGGAKIASIGVGVRRWISWHGFALNVSGDLAGFSAIVPCGLSGVAMTSLEQQTGRVIALAEVEAQVIRSFAQVFALHHAGPYATAPPPQT